MPTLNFFFALGDSIVVLQKLSRDYHTRFAFAVYHANSTRTSDKVLEGVLNQQLRTERHELRDGLTTVCGRVALRI